MAEFRPLSAIDASLRKYLGGGQGGTVLGAGYTDKINYSSEKLHSQTK